MVTIAAFYTCETGVPNLEQRAALECRLSGDYRRRLDRSRRAADRSETLAGLALLERSMTALGWDSPGLSRLEYPMNGAPGWAGGPRFSLAHTSGLTVCAIADSIEVRVGVDVERLRPIEPRVLRHVLEIESLGTTVERPAGVLGAWTAAEAVLKAAGASLRRLAELRLSADGSSARFAARTWYLQRLAVPTGYVATVACDESDFAVRPAVAA